MKTTFVLFGILGMAAVSNADIVFDNLPGVTPYNVPSLGYQATSTSEFGNKVAFGGTARDLTSATVMMSSWARKSEWTNVGDATGYDHDVTMNIYAAGAGDTVGALLGTKTQTFHMLYRPEGINPDGSGGWLAPDNNLYNGLAFNITFDLTGVLGADAPSEIIYGLAYNTQTYGASPMGVSGPYNSLNYGLMSAAPSVGTDVDADDVFWNTSFAGFYTDGGIGGVGTFRKDTAWSGFTPAVQFAAVPEPASMAALGMGALALLRRRRANKS